MNYIFLGGVFPKDREAELIKKSRGKLSFAANLHQWNMIEGLEAGLGKRLTVINAYFLPTYPCYAEKRISSFEWSHAEGAVDVNVGFRNRRCIRNFDQAKGIRREIGILLKRNGCKKTVVFVYSMNYPLMNAIYWMKKRGYDCNVCLIVPDVPATLSQFGDRKTLYDRFSSAYNLSRLRKYTQAVDCFVLLTDLMREVVSVGEKPHCVVDGLVSIERIASLLTVEGKPAEESGEIKKIVYTGTLHREQGICELIEAFHGIGNPDYRLLITGNGNAIGDVIKATEDDPRIEYLGILSDRMIRELQAEATVLVNPRQVNGIDARYSFPSKVMEYMLSGTPVLMNQLPGMDKIYEEYTYTPEKCGCTTFAEALVYVCELPKSERIATGIKAKQFIVENKSSTKQMQTVLAMLKENL